MFLITDEAKIALQDRLKSSAKPYIRMQMRHSCFMKLKLTMEEVKQRDDVLVDLEGMNFIMDKNHIHFFQNKKLDYIADKTGFKQFEIL